MMKGTSPLLLVDDDKDQFGIRVFDPAMQVLAAIEENPLLQLHGFQLLVAAVEACLEIAALVQQRLQCLPVS